MAAEVMAAAEGMVAGGILAAATPAAAAILEAAQVIPRVSATWAAAFMRAQRFIQAMPAPRFIRAAGSGLPITASFVRPR